MYRIKIVLILILTVCFTLISCSDEGEIPLNRDSISSSSSTASSSGIVFIADAFVIYSENVTGYANESANTIWNVWDGTCEIENTTIAAEGVSAKRIYNNNSNSIWWGFGVEAKTHRDMTEFINGNLVFQIKSTYSKAFNLGVQSGTWAIVNSTSSNAFVSFGSGSYGFVNDGNWHNVTIAFADLIAAAPDLDLTDISTFFYIQDNSHGGMNDPIYIDNIYFTKSGGVPTVITNPVLPQVPAPSTSADTWTSGTGWTLVWADEFNGTVLDMANWTHQVLPAGTFNSEWQRYTDSTNNSFIYHTNGGGYLVIRALHDGGPIASDHYTSARLHTGTKQDFQYGKIAARIQLPYGQGLWPAFWMLGTNITEIGGDTLWPACGELDIMEMIGGNGTTDTGDDSEYVGAIHWDNSGWTYSSITQALPSGILADDFHVFEIEWDSAQVVWKMDGTQFFSKDITPAHMSEFRKRFYILLNMAVGGEWPKYPNGATVFPQYMYIDWVRVYSKD